MYRDDILKTAKSLVGDTKELVVAAQASQDVLATAAQSAVGTVTSLGDHVKLAAAALGSDESDTQVGLVLVSDYPTKGLNIIVPDGRYVGN